MKQKWTKRIAFLTASLTCLMMAFAACSVSLKLGDPFASPVNTVEGLTLQAEADTVTATSLTLTLTNETDQTFASGNDYDFTLQAKEKGNWYAIREGDFNNTADARIFMPGSHTIEISWANRYGTLPAGEYRIVKNFFPEVSDEGLTEGYLLAAEFEIP